MAVKRPMPVAVCTKCGNASHNATLINQQCRRRFNGEWCKGLIRRATSENDWRECWSCRREGCAECKGAGWLSLRA